MRKLKFVAQTSIFTFCFISVSNAAISLDRTRVIYDAESKSMSVNISNINKQLPYLAQAWLEDQYQQKIVTGPLVLTPPLQRLEPNKSSVLRIEKTPETIKLPQDRESLFYLNLREIPPRSEKPNVMQIALQTKIKLFYRPQSIKADVGAYWFDKVHMRGITKGYSINNSTPYFITILDIEDGSSKSEHGFTPVMIPPKSTLDVLQGHFEAPVVTYINDFGGQDKLKFICKEQICTPELKTKSRTININND